MREYADYLAECREYGQEHPLTEEEFEVLLIEEKEMK